MSTIVQTPNAEAIAAWDGPLYDRFVQFRQIVTDGLGVHGEQALRLHPPRHGERVLDVGCGFGDTTQRLAALVGPDGEAVGVDAAARFIDTARHEADEAGVGNARFEVADVQQAAPGGPYEMAFSRFGTMFFANPVIALRNIRQALAPGGRLVMVVWRRRIDNDWIYRAQTIVEQIVTRPEEYDEPTCGPGPFSMADADTTTEHPQDRRLHEYRNSPLRRADHDREGHRRGDRVPDGARARRRDPPAPRCPRRTPTRSGPRRTRERARRPDHARRSDRESLDLDHQRDQSGMTMREHQPRLTSADGGGEVACSVSGISLCADQLDGSLESGGFGDGGESSSCRPRSVSS